MHCIHFGAIVSTCLGDAPAGLRDETPSKARQQPSLYLELHSTTNMSKKSDGEKMTENRACWRRSRSL
ncbi:unnamed protein product [Ectocarpus sp. 8 AP-2014]